MVGAKANIKRSSCKHPFLEHLGPILRPFPPPIHHFPWTQAAANPPSFPDTS